MIVASYGLILIQWNLKMWTLLGPGQNVQYNIGVSTFQGFEEFIVLYLH